VWFAVFAQRRNHQLHQPEVLMDMVLSTLYTNLRSVGKVDKVGAFTHNGNH
jgi:hypothetical protein